MWCLLLMLPAFAADRDLLLLGNSYTAANDLAGPVEAALEARPVWPEARVLALTRGGWTLSEHADAIDREGAWQEAADVDWDVVVVQDQSQIPGFGDDDPTVLGSQEALGRLQEAFDPAPLALMATWGRRDGDGQNPTLYPDFPTMQDRLTEGYLAYAATLGGATVVPVGEVFRAVWMDDPDGRFRQLYRSDGSHPSPYGTFVAAATLHAALTGRDPSEVDAPWAEADDAELDALREEVRQVVLAEPFGPYGYPWAQDWTDGRGQVGEAGLRPVVRVVGDGVADQLTVGGVDGGHPADGEVWVAPSASLRVDVLEVGVSGTGGVTVDGTLVVADELRLGAGAVLSWTGTLEASRVTGDLLQEAGVLRIEPPLEVQGAWTARGGRLEVASLPTAPGEHVLATADALDLAGLDVGELVVEVRADGAREALVWTVDGTAVDPGPEEGDAPAETGKDKGCGCDGAAPGPGWSLGWLSRR